MRFTVLREGISQRAKPGADGKPGPLIDCPVGSVIEVSDIAAPRLVEQGFIAPIEVPKPAVLKPAGKRED